MFYSQCLLSRKGSLGTVWIAAHCLKRVKKGQVTQTNISSSVDKILIDEVPVVSYRVLGYLLLGVVRIYSKKVEYLFHDCRQVLVKMNDFAGGKKDNSNIEAICASYLSITRPERFELDAFDLQILEDGSGINVRPDENIVLADALDNKGTEHFSFDKHHCQEDAADTCSTAYTPVKDVLSPYVLKSDGLATSLHNLSNSEASIEKLRGNNFSLEECLDPMSPDDDEEEPGPVKPSGEKYQTDGEQIKFPDTENVIGVEKEPSDLDRSFDEEQHMSAEQIKLPEMILPETEKCQIAREDRPLSITIDVTPLSKCPNTSGAATPEFMVVHTPATKESSRVSRKRKCLFDDVVVFPNKVLKESINNPSDLVCKRRKAPYTALDIWKADQITNLPHTFLEPSMTCQSLELRSLFCWKKLKRPEAIEIEALEKLDVLGSPTVHRTPDEVDIAPSTPVTQSSSLRLHEETFNLDRVDPASSCIEKQLSPSEYQELDISLINEETTSCEGDNQKTNEWSFRTRTLARYLYSSFQHRKTRREDGVVNLSQVLKRKTRSESARLFYEILVLKSRGYIDVKQQEAYDDILVLGTPKLKESL